jgi:hypothetical protein
VKQPQAVTEPNDPFVSSAVGLPTVSFECAAELPRWLECSTAPPKGCGSASVRLELGFPGMP